LAPAEGGRKILRLTSVKGSARMIITPPYRLVSTAPPSPIFPGAGHAPTSLLDQRHPGRLLPPPRGNSRRKPASPCGRKHCQGRCVDFWAGNLRDDGRGVAVGPADRRAA